MKNVLKSYNIFTLIFLAVILLTVIFTPIYGLGDLSEYTSVFESVGLYNSSSDAYAIAQNYGISQPDGSEKSVFHIFLMLLISINKLLFSKTIFNIHFISIVYSFIFIIGMYFLQKNLRFEKDYLNYVFSALLGLVFLDLGYIAYFNSFYTDALMFVLIIALVALAVASAKKFSYVKLILFAICLCLFSSMRFSSAVTVLCASAILFLLSLMIKRKGKIATAIVSVVVAVVSVFYMVNATVPARDIKLYNLIYNDLAVENESAPEFFGVEGTKLSENPDISEMEEAVDGITYGDVFKYYASHPKQFTSNIKSAANNAYFLIQDFASYHEAGAYYGVREGMTIKIWNFLKRRVLPNGLWVILLFIAVYAVVAVREYLKNKKAGEFEKAYISLFAVILPVGALSEIVATVLTTGKILISKNMFVFGIYFDLMIITAVVWTAATLIARNNAIKEKYGVRQ